MEKEILDVVAGEHYLKNYDETYRDFDWKSIEQEFSWATTGKVNMAYECIDRHAASDKKDKVALYYQDDNRKEQYSFHDLQLKSNQAANVFKQHADIQKGDRVFTLMPRIPEFYFAALGAIKLGAIIGPLFEAFMESAVKDRLLDSGAKTIITMPQFLDRIPFEELPELETVFVVGEVDPVSAPYETINFLTVLESANNELDITWVDREDGLIIHYTSGSTGKPKGVLHVHNAMVQQLQTGRWVLDLKDEDIYWCTADPGWVSGTSYGIFAPWLNGATSLVIGGRFQAEQWYQMITDYKVTIWYSAPTAYRMLMKSGTAVAQQFDLSTLRHVLSVGEPLNPEVIRWGLATFNKRIHDTWWMTETGAHMICNYPTLPIKLGSMGKPVPGIEAAIVDDFGNVLPPLTLGNLAIKKGWPAMMRAIWNNEERYRSYFIDEWYVTGDSAHMDQDGYFWFHGRVDDVILTAGERVGPFEVESKLIEHPAVTEAGVIGKPDDLRGQIIKAFVSLADGYQPTEALKQEIILFVKSELAGHAYPRELEFIDKLPKTRSGKIMRRVLKAQELSLPVGDLSTIED